MKGRLNDVRIGIAIGCPSESVVVGCKTVAITYGSRFPTGAIIMKGGRGPLHGPRRGDRSTNNHDALDDVGGCGVE